MSTVLRGEFASTKTFHFIAGQTYYIPAGPFSENTKCLLAVFWQNCRSQNIADSILAILSVQSKYGQSDTRNVKRSYWKPFIFCFETKFNFRSRNLCQMLTEGDIRTKVYSNFVWVRTSFFHFSKNIFFVKSFFHFFHFHVEFSAD